MPVDYVESAPSIFVPVYRCEICGQPAAFGFGVFLIQGIAGKWYCASVEGSPACRAGGAPVIVAEPPRPALEFPPPPKDLFT